MGKKKFQLSKIIYFDEGSVTDYIQIILGGKLEKTTELLTDDASSGEAGVNASASVGIGKTFRSLIGFGAEASVDSSIKTAFNTREMAKNIIKNTILTYFLDIVDNDEKTKDVITFIGYNLSVHKDSLTYIALIAPYLSMLKGGTTMPSGEFNVAIDKIENAMKSAKGYYEFIGEKDKKRIVFRFNIKSFKNNYRVTDLLKMDIIIFAIKVGATTLDKLNINSELNIEDNVVKDNPSYSPNKEKIKKPADDEELEVYDVLLSGVVTND